jgi:ubiquinone biosynthesis protein UbiJ
MLTERLQAVLDEKVAGSPRARELLALLDGKCLRVIVRHTPWQVALAAGQGRVRLLRDAAPDADVTLSGTPLSMLALLREDPAEVIRRGDVALAGDGEAGTRFQELALLLRPEFEEGLSRLIGDVPAWGVGSLLRSALAFGRTAVATQATNAGEYLAHEKRVLVPRAEARAYIEGVDVLREQADRLAVRVTQLEGRGK